MSDYTFFLFARPSVIEGVARLSDFAGTLSRYNVSETGLQADRRAICADWMAVGADIRQAVQAHEEFANTGRKP